MSTKKLAGGIRREASVVSEYSPWSPSEGLHPSKPRPSPVTVHVGRSGFRDPQGIPYEANKILSVPRGTLLVMRFQDGEGLMRVVPCEGRGSSSAFDLALGHGKGSSWIMSRGTSLIFRPGEDGRARYRATCMVRSGGTVRVAHLLIRIDESESTRQGH